MDSVKKLDSGAYPKHATANLFIWSVYHVPSVMAGARRRASRTQFPTSQASQPQERYKTS